MDLKRKFDIAVRLLEHEISMYTIRFCSSQELSEMAQRI